MFPCQMALGRWSSYLSLVYLLTDLQMQQQPIARASSTRGLNSRSCLPQVAALTSPPLRGC